jgi:hypothetical protein
MIAAADKTLKQLFVAVTDLCIHLNGYLFWVIKGNEDIRTGRTRKV